MDPLVRVARAHYRCGFRTNGMAWKEWDLQLDCGCHEARPVRHKRGGERGWGALWRPQPRSRELPPPVSVRHSCPNIRVD